MTDFSTLVGALADSFKAAMVGLNPIPVIILAVLFGLIQGKGYIFKALLAVALGAFAAAIWPAAYNSQPIWPDVRQMETQIQLGTLLVIAYIIIRIFGLFRGSLSLNLAQTSKA